MNTTTRATIIVTIALLTGLAFNAAAATITSQPTGDGLWSTPGNWIGGVAPASGDSVTLVINSGYAPTNVDIANIALNVLTFSNDTSGVTLIGNDFKFNNIICNRAIVPVVTNVIKQNVFMMKTSAWTVNSKSYLIFEGVLGATNPTYAVRADGNGTVILNNTNTFAGGVQQNQAYLMFYRDASLGLVPATPQSNYFLSGSGSYIVNPTAGYSKVVIHPNRGMQFNAQLPFMVTDPVKLVYGGQITGYGMNFMYNWAAGGILMLGGSNYTCWGSWNVGNGVLVMNHDYALGVNTVGSGVAVSLVGTLDLNGHDLLNRDIGSNNGTGYSASGMFKNTNTNRTSTVNGTWRNGSTAGTMFGGRGDIIYTGNILGLNPVRKIGTGTLTM